MRPGRARQKFHRRKTCPGQPSSRPHKARRRTPSRHAARVRRTWFASSMRPASLVPRRTCPAPLACSPNPRGCLLPGTAQGGGVARSLIDDACCCWLSDLAVDKEHQGSGICGELVRRKQAVIGEEVRLVLLTAPGATSFYLAVGFAPAANAFISKQVRRPGVRRLRGPRGRQRASEDIAPGPTGRRTDPALPARSNVTGRPARRASLRP